MAAHPSILNRADLCTVRRKLAAASKTVVFTNGCFDLLHRGSVELLCEAAELGDVLMVGVNSDASVRALKGPGRPLLAEEDRAFLLATLRPVSYVCLFDEVSVESLIADLLPDVLVKGGDYAPHEIVGAHLVKGAGGRVEALSYYKGASTTALSDRIRELAD